MTHPTTPLTPEERAAEIERLFKEKHELREALEREPATQAYRRAQDRMLETTIAAGKQGNSKDILELERMHIFEERDYLPRTKRESASYTRVLEQLATTEALFALIRDHKKYAMIAQTFGKRGCVHGVPKDAARWFFKDHQKWLARKFLRSRMTKTEVTIIETRQENLRIAEKAYDVLQRKALGLLHT
jgi:hypothetical protein